MFGKQNQAIRISYSQPYYTTLSSSSAVICFVSNTAVLKNCGLGACSAKHDVLPAVLLVLVNLGYFTLAPGPVSLRKGHTC